MRGETCGQDKIASIQAYGLMVALSNSKELCPDSFQRVKGLRQKLTGRTDFISFGPQYVTLGLVSFSTDRVNS